AAGDEGANRLSDPDRGYRELAGIAAGGALLVRPDKHVAWRTAELPDDPAEALTEVVRTIMSGTAPHADGAGTSHFATITDAREVLRSGVGRGHKVFDSGVLAPTPEG